MSVDTWVVIEESWMNKYVVGDSESVSSGKVL